MKYVFAAYCVVAFIIVACVGGHFVSLKAAWCTVPTSRMPVGRAVQPDDRPGCFARQNPGDMRFYLAELHEDGASFVWVGSWDSLTLATEAAKLINCRFVVDPTMGY